MRPTPLMTAAAVVAAAVLLPTTASAATGGVPCHGVRIDGQTQFEAESGAFVGTAQVEAIGLSFPAQVTVRVLPDGSTAHTIAPVPDGIPTLTTTDDARLLEDRDGNPATYALRSLLHVESPLDGELRLLPGSTIDLAAGTAKWRASGHVCFGPQGPSR